MGEENPIIFFSKVQEKKQGGRKKIKGCISFEGKEICFPVWRPNIWNKLCLMFDEQNKHLLFSINEIQRLNTSYDNMPDVNGRIVMMNGNIYGWGPMYGSVTDFHVWDRLINEVNDYPLLSTNHTPGSIISWETAVVETDLLLEHSEVLFFGNPQFELFRKVKNS